MNITNKYGPNTTILLPGSCNAHCGFCFWNRDEGKIKPPQDYIDKVFKILADLPKEFETLSLSGGEPTLSPQLTKLLTRLGKFRRTNDRFQRVVLTTHGGNLLEHLPAIGCVADHINISRHAIGTKNNRDIFKTKGIPSDEELRDIITEVHDMTECDVTLNCVVPPNVTVKFCNDFIHYARYLGADAVSFRKQAGTVAPTRAEKSFVKKYGVLAETKCPVCRGLAQTVDGFDVRWKGTVHEPSVDTGGVYEVVIHPDGEAYSDWGMKHPIDLTPKKKKKRVVKSKQPVPVGCRATNPPTHGCGSRIINGCGARSYGCH
jgi:MoaA/NifB/PqqE/SkfB family radical SAM enzyme